jgi:hypothetical protein
LHWSMTSCGDNNMVNVTSLEQSVLFPVSFFVLQFALSLGYGSVYV